MQWRHLWLEPGRMKYGYDSSGWTELEKLGLNHCRLWKSHLFMGFLFVWLVFWLLYLSKIFTAKFFLLYSCLYQCNANWQDTDIWRKIHYFQIRYQLSTWIERIVSDILQPSSQKFYMLTIQFWCEKFVEICCIWSGQ